MNGPLPGTPRATRRDVPHGGVLSRNAMERRLRPVGAIVDKFAASSLPRCG